MHVIDAAVLGIVEGLTEFLPVSSTGHLILASKILGLPESGFWQSFEIIIQLGAIAAIALLYFKKFFDPTILKKIIIGSIPTAAIGFLLYPIVKKYFLGTETIVVWALLIGGVLMIACERLFRNRASEESGVREISNAQAFLIGIFQSIAIIPGVSRSAATIIGGLALGIPRTAIVEFSFLLAVPVIAGAAGLDLVSSGLSMSRNEVLLLVVGFVTAFVVALMSIKIFLRFVKTNDFTPFGIYRIAIALIFLLFIL